MLPDGAVSFFVRRQRLQCEEGLRLDHRADQAVGDAAAVDSSTRYALLALQGRPRARFCNRSPAWTCARSGPIGSPTGKWPMRGRRFRERDIAAKTGSRSSCRRTWPTRCGRRCSNPADRPMSFRAVSARAIRFASKRRCGYGNDIDESTSVLEAGLDWTVAWSKTEFIGRDRLVEQRAQGVARTLVGLEMDGSRNRPPRIPGRARRSAGGRCHERHPDPVSEEGDCDGVRPPELAATGAEIDVDIRGRASKARVVPLPFYKRRARGRPL